MTSPESDAGGEPLSLDLLDGRAAFSPGESLQPEARWSLEEAVEQIDFRAPQTQKWARGPLPDTALPNLKVPDF